MNTQHALILAVTTGLFLIGCTSTRDEGARNERHIERLMGHHGWPLIRQIAEAEVKRREILWPERADYLPVLHEDKVWGVTAMTGTPKGDVQRVVMMTIGDDGNVQTYQRYWEGQPVPEFPDARRVR
jgi:hypothetical protein